MSAGYFSIAAASSTIPHFTLSCSSLTSSAVETVVARARYNLQDRFCWGSGRRSGTAASVAFGALRGARWELICRENLLLLFPWLPRSGVGILLPAGRSCRP